MSLRPSKSRKHAKAKADKYFSLYIRTKYAKNGLVRCVTCGKFCRIKGCHCGHFMSRRYEATRYDEKNTGPQCPSCNTFHQGKQFKFGQWIDLQFGEGTAEKIEMKSKMKCFRKKHHYEQIAEEYYQKLKQLEAA